MRWKEKTLKYEDVMQLSCWETTESFTSEEL